MSQDLAKLTLQLSDLADINKQLLHHAAMQTHHVAQIEATMKEILKLTREKQNPQAAARLKELRGRVG